MLSTPRMNSPAASAVVRANVDRACSVTLSVTRKRAATSTYVVSPCPRLSSPPVCAPKTVCVSWLTPTAVVKSKRLVCMAMLAWPPRTSPKRAGSFWAVTVGSFSSNVSSVTAPVYARAPNAQRPKLYVAPPVIAFDANAKIGLPVASNRDAPSVKCRWNPAAISRLPMSYSNPSVSRPFKLSAQALSDVPSSKRIAPICVFWTRASSARTRNSPNTSPMYRPRASLGFNSNSLRHTRGIANSPSVLSSLS